MLQINHFENVFRMTSSISSSPSNHNFQAFSFDLLELSLSIWPNFSIISLNKVIETKEKQNQTILDPFSASSTAPYPDNFEFSDLFQFNSSVVFWILLKWKNLSEKQFQRYKRQILFNSFDSVKLVSIKFN